jgi:hypothetical protein
MFNWRPPLCVKSLLPSSTLVLATHCLGEKYQAMAKGPAEIAYVKFLVYIGSLLNICSLGPMLIGTVFNIVLYGIMITQVYLYFNTYKLWVASNFLVTRCQLTRIPRDRKWLKCLVLFLFLADTVNALFDLVYVYDALIINFSTMRLKKLFLALILYLLQTMWNIWQKPPGSSVQTLL